MVEIDRTRAKYLNDEDIDVLARQNVALMTELWMVKDRLAVLEKLLAEAGLIDDGAVDGYLPEGEFADMLEHARAAYVERVVAMPPEARTVESLKMRSAKVRARS